MSDITLGIIGASGKLGSKILSLAKNDPRFSSVLGSTSTATPPFVSTEEVFKKSHIIIDVSTSANAEAHINLALAYQKPLVIGTTGHSSPLHSLLEKASRQIPVMHASNFSFAITLLSQTIKKFSTFFPFEKFSITETHNQHKKDKPSGTALLFAKQIKDQEKISITSHRIGDIIAEHRVSFLSEDEEVIFIHKGISRDAYAKGGIQAALFLLGKPPGLYHMDDLL